MKGIDKGAANTGGGEYSGSGKYPFKGGTGRDNSGYAGDGQNGNANHEPSVNTKVNSGPGASLKGGGGSMSGDY